MNLTSVFLLTSLFLQTFGNGTIECHIINISSGAAHNAYDGWSNYSTTKSARHMLHQVIALEEDPNIIKSLNFKPGILYYYYI